jgi:hypothetical protein
VAFVFVDLAKLLRVHCQPACDLYLVARQVVEQSRIDPPCIFGLGFLVLCHLRESGGFA